MSKWWGWVDIFRDGTIAVGQRSKQPYGDTLMPTGDVAPENVAEVMTLVDLLPPNTKLPGGSRKTNHNYIAAVTYFIAKEDLQTNGETS